MNRCPHCQETRRQVKVGRTKAGSQRYQCQFCRRRYTPQPKQHGYLDSVRQQALRLYADGMNLRQIARHLGVVHQTVANWVAAQAASLPDRPPQPDRLTAQTFAAEQGLSFRDMTLLVQALTHRSYLNETPDPDTGDNERLEFLGDAVLNFIVGDWLFRQFPAAPEGQLTRLRAALVRKETLADLARRLRIGAALRIGRGEEKGGGRDRSSTLSSAFEAVIGALFVDQGLEPVRAFLMPLLVDALDAIQRAHLDRDARSDLQERVQALYNLTPTYRYHEPTGPDHQREFRVDVLIGERVIASGSGHSKQAAAMDAARRALAALDAR